MTKIINMPFGANVSQYFHHTFPYPPLCTILKTC